MLPLVYQLHFRVKLYSANRSEVRENVTRPVIVMSFVERLSHSIVCPTTRRDVIRMQMILDVYSIELGKKLPSSDKHAHN